MVNRCVICKKYSRRGCEKSMHRMPRSNAIRKLWMDKLKLTVSQFSKWVYVCSDHFCREDFIYKSGRKYLKIEAMPSRNLPLYDPCTSGVPSQGPVDQVKVIGPRKDGNGHSSSATLTASDLSATLTASDLSATLTASELSTTLTASDLSATLSASELSMKMSANITASQFPGTVTASCSSRELVSADDSAKHSAPIPTSRKRKRKHFVGDVTDEDFKTPEQGKFVFSLAKRRIEEQNRTIKTLRKQKSRLQEKITDLSGLLNDLKEKNLISDNAQDHIETLLPGPSREMVNRLIKGSRKEKISASLRAFALTLHFYSPRAYSYVREKFNNCLPHPKTISKWYQSIDGSPGFTAEAISALKCKIQQSAGKQIYCNLVMDEMSIRKKIEFINGKFYGTISFGNNPEVDTLPEAREALVFLVTSINGHWKIPVGYFLIDGLSSKEKSNLVKNCLEFLIAVDLKITSITFDGTASNLNMAHHLGADFSDPKSLKTFFEHPVTKEKIFIFLDPCHMLKLVRNCLGDSHILKAPNNDLIKWSYLEELVKLQNSEGLNAATKIKRRHLHFAREKMKVKIAAQTFSKSVSDALKFLEFDLKIADFNGAKETAEFCLLINDIFDILNSRNQFSTYPFKRALSPLNIGACRIKFAEASNYFMGMTLDGIPVLSSRRKTGFLGFLICMKSLEEIFLEYVVSEKMKFLLSYKFSQDHLEVFFGAIRSMNGFNNNPTARQFQSAYKKLLMAREVKAADSGNVLSLDNTSILHVSSYKKITVNDHKEDMEESDEYRNVCEALNDHDYFGSSGWKLSSYTQDVLIYIAGFVIKSLKKCVTCSKCLNMLETSETFSLLQKRKTYGNLFKPSEFIIKICTQAEKTLRYELFINPSILRGKSENLLNKMITDCIRKLPSDVFTAFGDHIYDGEMLDSHELPLIKLISKRYFTIRIHHETRKMSDQVANRVRSMLTHLVLFQNQ